MKAHLKKDMKSKTGVAIATGELVEVRFDVKNKSGELTPSYFSVTTKDGRRLVSGRPEKVGIKVPGAKKLDRLCADSICETVFGDTTEPDGWGSEPEPSPSWLLFLGMI